MIANARMYCIDPVTTAQWRVVLEWVIARARVRVEVIDYPAPLPLRDLWTRDDLACGLMCGFPLAHASPQPSVIAALVPSPRRYGQAAVYCTDLVVRADSPWQDPVDVIGKRIGFTTEDSQSGYQAPRRFFAPFAASRRSAALFSAAVGPLVTPRRVALAVAEGDADVGPLDSYAYDLLRLHEPSLAARLRVIASTPITPIPPFVAAAGTPEAVVAALRDAFMDVASAGELDAARQALLLQGFDAVPAQRYRELAVLAREADALQYPRLG